MVHLDPAVGVVQRPSGVLLAVPVRSTIDTRSMVSLHIFHTKLTFLPPVLAPCVVLRSDWLLTFSNMF